MGNMRVLLGAFGAPSGRMEKDGAGRLFRVKSQVKRARKDAQRPRQDLEKWWTT